MIVYVRFSFIIIKKKQLSFCIGYGDARIWAVHVVVVDEGKSVDINSQIILLYTNDVMDVSGWNYLSNLMVAMPPSPQFLNFVCFSNAECTSCCPRTIKTTACFFWNPSDLAYNRPIVYEWMYIQNVLHDSSFSRSQCFSDKPSCSGRERVCVDKTLLDKIPREIKAEHVFLISDKVRERV